MITIVIPSFNEGETVQGFINELEQVLKNEEYKIIVVDDGSTDGSCNGLMGKSIAVVRHNMNRGYGASLKTGILKSDGEWIVMCDADGQHRAEDVLAVVKQLKDYDVVIGARDKESYAPVIRKPGKKLLSMVANYLAETKIPDLNSGLRAFRRPVVMCMLHLMPDGFSFSTTSTLAALKTGYNVHYTPIITRKRQGKSTVSQLRHGAQTMLLIIRLVTLFNPLKVFLPISALLFLLGIMQFVVESIMTRIHITPIALIFFVSAVLVFFFGILTDQVAALRREFSVYDRNNQPS